MLALPFGSTYSFWQTAEFLLRIVTACACGAVIGLERSRRLKEAGIRTHIIVCCAAALVMIVSKYGFADVSGPNGEGILGTHGTDPARLAAQVITGVSFLGAGIIFRNGNSVKGLTTAAGIWATAGIGLAIGAGMYVLGILVTGVMFVAQILTHRFTVGVDSMVVGRMQCSVSNSADFRQKLDDYISRHRMQILEIRVDLQEDGGAEYDLTLRMGQDITITDLSTFLGSMNDVHALSIEMGS
ncbi:MAG: MgtC/SapB family protein [Lachnospiraceae bacterium]|nr:MgtC/SapB family protein [Lachnospiraceae bacterium]